MRIFQILFLSCLLLSAQANNQASNTDKNNAFNLLSFFANASIQKTFKDYPKPHHLWFYSSFSQQSMQENTSLNLDPSKIQTLFFQGGYDYAFSVDEGKNFLGLSLEYGDSKIISKLKEGKAHSFALTIYDFFKHQNGFFFQPSIKYIFSTQKLSSSLSSKLLLAQIHLGYRMNFWHLIYLKPVLEVGFGYLPSLFNSNFPLFLKAGGYFGIDFQGALRGDIYLGSFLNSDFLFKQTAKPNHHRLLLSLGANLTLSENLKLFLKAQTSFLGQTHLDYSAGIGLRFLFGQGNNLAQFKRPTRDERTLQQVQQELLYQSELYRQRIQEKTYLKPEELNLRQQLQEKRDSALVQDEIKYSKRQRAIREGAKWINTKQNEENYQSRDFPVLQGQDKKAIESRYKRELERKYGK